MALRDLTDRMPERVRGGSGRQVRIPAGHVLLDESSPRGGVRVVRTAPLERLQEADRGEVPESAGYGKYLKRWQTDGQGRSR